LPVLLSRNPILSAVVFQSWVELFWLNPRYERRLRDLGFERFHSMAPLWAFLLKLKPDIQEQVGLVGL
jgi:hypothetical protein